MQLVGGFRFARYLALAPLFAASLAHAQAPGEVMPQPAEAMPQPAETTCVTVCGCRAIAAAPSVMDNRWALGFSVGSLGLAPAGQPDSKTSFGIGELALRFRATLHLELELSVGGGREQLDNMQGDLEVTLAALSARYRFNPEGRWSWWLMAGVGGASIVSHEASQQERDQATQPVGMLGIGLERRFGNFALQAEARVVGLGEAQHSDAAVPEPSGVMPMTTTTTPPKQSGGSLTLGLSYYF